MKSCWIKPGVIEHLIFPQYPYFCGIAACGCVANTLLDIHLTQIDLHAAYGIGNKCKMKIPLAYDFSDGNFDQFEPRGMGISNWDIIRLFNAILLDKGSTPYSALLTGKDLVSEIENGRYGSLEKWLQGQGNHAVIHLEDHYVTYAGAISTGESDFIVCADSSKFKGPLNSLNLNDLIALAASDGTYNRYGFILLSDQEIPLKQLFKHVTADMRPKESEDCQRFDRI